MAAASDHRSCFSEIRLRMPRRVGERHEHLPTAPLPLPDRRPCPRTGGGLRPPSLMIVWPPVKPLAMGPGPVAAPWPDFAQTIRYPPGGVVLPAMHIRVPVEPRLDDLAEPIRLRPPDRRRAPIAGGCRERRYLVHTVTRDVQMARRRALADAVGAGRTNLPVTFHGLNRQALHAVARRAKRPTFTPPAARRSRRYRGRLLHRRSQKS